MIISPGVFFQFFNILILWVVSVVKGHFISQEPYIIYICNMIISSGVLFIFAKKLIFLVHSG